MSVRTSGSIALGTALALLLIVALICPCLSDQGETSGVENVPSLSGIWSIEGLEEVGGVVMALEQNGSELNGKAKYEPDSGKWWNGQVIGSATGDEIELVVISGQNESIVSLRMEGKYIKANQSLVGEFIRASGGSIMKRGGFVAISINPDISLYAPAIIGNANDRMESQVIVEHLSGDKKASVGGKSQSNLTYPADISQSNQTMQNNGLTDSRYYDVHRDEESILTGICSPGPALS